MGTILLLAIVLALLFGIGGFFLEVLWWGLIVAVGLFLFDLFVSRRGPPRV